VIRPAKRARLLVSAIETPSESPDTGQHIGTNLLDVRIVDLRLSRFHYGDKGYRRVQNATLALESCAEQWQGQIV